MRQESGLITSRRWVTNFRMYLRDTAVIQHQHVGPFLAASLEVMGLITALPVDILALSTTMTDGMNDPGMHK